MSELRTALIIAVLAALVFGVVSVQKRHFYEDTSRGCSDDPYWNSGLPPCRKPSRDTTTTTTQDTTSATSPTPLERAQWCRFGNGSYLPLGQAFMHTVCAMCQCTTSRAIRCTALQCLPTYCIDNSMPSRRDGQCCAQCAYESNTTSCLYNGVTFPHGTIMKSVESKMQCWCQLGNIECRSYMGSLFDGLDLMSDSGALFIIAIVLLIVVTFGLLMCCGCTVLFYHYYQRHQGTFQQTYDQYLNAAGWQPMYEEEEEYQVDSSVNEKQLEAEKGAYTSANNEMTPPPYSVFDNPDAPAKAEQKK